VLVERQELLSSILGPLAILAGAIVAVLASRERRLARALAATYQRERRLRAESEERRVALERVTESKTRLMRGFTHDVKNPLGAADGFLELIQEELHGPLTESQRDIIGRVRRSLRTALKLVADLLDIARAEAGHIQLTFAPTNVCRLVVELSEEFRGQAQAKGLELRVDAGCELPDVITDIARLRQVLGNLISNAVKYTDRGSVAIGVKTASDKFVIVAVTDTGRGIAADKLELLFEEFVRLDPTVAEGAGVGLAITRRIAHALGAEITVTSELGRGSVFSLKLPMDGRPTQTVS
jgi:signal transduction histidine kinase